MRRVFVKLTVHPEVNLLLSRSKPFDWLVGQKQLTFKRQCKVIAPPFRVSIVLVFSLI